MQSADPVARVGRDQRQGFSIENRIERMLLVDRRNILEIWRKIFSDLEKHVAKYIGDLEKTCLAIWRKRVRRFGETRSAKTLEIWRNVVGAVMAISFWSSSWSGVELSDRKWRFKP